MNDSKATGIFDEAKGKVKQAVGETFGDQSLANSGAKDEVKGHAEQTWGSVKDTAEDLRDRDAERRAETHAENTGHDVRSNITNAAERLKESIQQGLGHVERKANDYSS